MTTFLSNHNGNESIEIKNPSFEEHVKTNNLTSFLIDEQKFNTSVLFGGAQ